MTTTTTTSAPTTIDRNELFVDGTFVRAQSDERIQAINPATEEVIGSVPDSNAADVDRAVTSAVRAFPLWSNTSGAERAKVLRAIADGIRDRSDELKQIIQLENGAPRWWVNQDVGLTEVAYRQAAAEAEQLQNEELVDRFGHQTILRREPLGVVAAIAPWNSPSILMAFKAATALAAGCTVVTKPSPETTLDSYVFAEILSAAGLPAGAYNIVPGGSAAGAALVSHPGIAKVSFTGSTAVGRQIAAVCGQLLRPMIAELGGKSAAILLDDADLDVFLGSVQSFCVPFSGQACFSTTRILVPADRHDEVLAATAAKLQSFAFGDPADEATVMGPVITAKQRARIEELIASGVDQGAQIVLGGGRPAAFDRGFYIEPTIFSGVTPEMRIFQQEIFGPVLTFTPYHDEEEARSLHDATTYGLSGAVFSRDVARATEFSRGLNTGQLLINGDRGVPFIARDMYNDSAAGGGVDRVEGFLQTKAISQPAA
ncbi:aldehyde dehydrogenase family protein [Subtercola lobariae]|uniref:aldehyde dehydrogenase family protein n=1 Tax=Subtercola lobariae TaxID=1588641 RepID=UPI001942A1AD|nr:aldehyde dehydrogenase family protein [Subtercola lobariae]